jgi:hypothetical protein
MTAFMPACYNCNCSAELHTTILAPAEDHGDVHISETFEMGPCRFCDCRNYGIAVPKSAYVVFA